MRENSTNTDTVSDVAMFESVAEGMALWAAFLKKLEECPDEVISRWFTEKLPVVNDNEE